MTERIEANGEATFDCHRCRDGGFVSHEIASRNGEPIVPCTVAWFCDCHGGRMREAGHWFDKCYPGDERRRVVSPAGKEQLDKYLQARPAQKLWLFSAIESLRSRYEDALKR